MMDKITETLTRGVAEIFPSKEGLASLMKMRKITLYQGFDPSMPSLHLGHLAGLMKLRAFQKLGHKVIFLVGDFTGMIGDPTDKLSTRKKLTREEVLKNSAKWKEQASRVLDFEGDNPAVIDFNSRWSDKLNFKNLIEVCSNLTVQQLLERDMFQKRLKENKPIFLHEFLYPVAQGYDCVAMDVDLEIGGSDQIFNMLVGRNLMKALKNKEKFVLGTKLLVDKDGDKVGKTTGNALFFDSTPNEFYAGVMSFPDETITLGFELLTEVPLQGIEEKTAKNPMLEKKRLAYEIVKLLWGEKKASIAQGEFEKTFQEKNLPTNTKTTKVGANSLALMDLIFSTKVVLSRSEVKRLISQKAIEINGKVHTNPTENIEIPDNGLVIKIGKKKFIKAVPK
jgi:tyrosyl-tRNA synthetase